MICFAGRTNRAWMLPEPPLTQFILLVNLFKNLHSGLDLNHFIHARAQRNGVNTVLLGARSPLGSAKSAKIGIVHGMKPESQGQPVPTHSRRVVSSPFPMEKIVRQRRAVGRMFAFFYLCLSLSLSFSLSAPWWSLSPSDGLRDEIRFGTWVAFSIFSIHTCSPFRETGLLTASLSKLLTPSHDQPGKSSPFKS